MTMYKKTMREALQEVSSYKLEEEVELDEALNPKDKKVVDAFYDGRSMDGKMLSTDGKKLEKTGMGGQTIASKSGSKFKIVAKMDSGSTQDVVKYIEKSFPKNVIEEVELDEAKMSPKQIAALKKAYEPMRGGRISTDNATKLGKLMDRFDKDKDLLIQLFKADIPFVSKLAMTRLITKHNMKGAEINKLRKEELGEQIVDKYLNTKQGSLEESVLEIWKEAANITEKKLDPVGKEDDDVDNDGDVDSSDKYLAKRRKAISKAMKKEGLEDSPNAANSQHLCAKNVVHEEWGNGECIPTMHDEPDEEGNIGWYDVMFEHGLEKGVAINELKVTHSEMHHNHKKKKNDEEVEELDEISKDTYVSAMKSKTMTYDDDRAGDTSKILKRAEREKGKKFAKQLDGIDKDKPHSYGYYFRGDKLAKRQPARVTKSGKANQQDVKTLKKTIAGKLKAKKESYEMGTDEYRKHTQSITPGQDVTDFQNFKVESMREALAKVWGKAGDELEEYVTKEGIAGDVGAGIGRLAGRAAVGAAKLAGKGAFKLAKKGARAARERITTGGKADRAERQLSKAQKQSKKKMSDKDRLAIAQARLAKLNKGKSKTESYEMGTDEYRKHTQSITPGQDVTDFQNFKVESMREALAKVWGKAGDELEEYVTKEGMRRRVAEGDKRRTENKDTGKGGKTMTGKTSDVINLKPTTEEVELDEAMSKDMALKILSMAKNQDFKIASGDRAPMIYLSNDDRDELKKEFGRLGRDVPGPNKGATVMQIVNLAHSGNDRKPFDTEGGKHMISWDKGGKKIGTPKKVSDAAKLAGLKLEEVELDEVAPLIGMAAKALAKGALMGVGSKIADKAMGGKKEEKMLAADYMIKSGKSAEEVADVANVDVEEIKKVMAAYHEDDEKHYKEYLAAACSGGTGLGTTSMST